MSIRFGCFTLDSSSRELRAGQDVIHLSPKGFQLLSTLIEQRPRAIAKKELQDHLWPSTFVADTNLANLIAEVRAALDDDPRKPQFIRTVYGFGYAFSGDAREEAAAAAAIQRPAPVRPRWSVAALSILAMTTTLSMKSSHREPIRAHRSIESIAVLPFKVSSPIAADAYFGLGMADVITSRLSNVGEMTVRPTSAVAGYGSKGQDPIAAGAQLRVDAVLDGMVRRAGNRIRVSVQLFNIHEGRAMWGETFDENFTEAFKLEDAVAERVTSALALELTDEEQRLLGKRHTEDSEAYRSYIAGRYTLMREFSSGGKESIPHFQAALRHDASYAPAYAGLSQAYAKLAIFNESSPAPLWEKAAAAAKQALAHDSELSDAHAALALVRMQMEWNWEDAEKEFKRAIELNRSNGMAHRYYAMLLMAQGRFEEAIARRKRAMQLDPLSLSVNFELATTYYMARRFDEAIKQHRLVLTLEPKYFRSISAIGQPLVAQHRTAEALESYRNALALDENYVLAKVWLARTEAVAGRPAESQRLLKELQEKSRKTYISPYHLAIVHTALGQQEEACTLLEAAAEQRSSVLLNVAVEPAFDTLRSHPRYIALIRRIRLN